VKRGVNEVDSRSNRNVHVVVLDDGQYELYDFSGVPVS
jgi:hypothetical protein